MGASKHGESDGRGGWVGGQTLDFNMRERKGKGRGKGRPGRSGEISCKVGRIDRGRVTHLGCFFA